MPFDEQAAIDEFWAARTRGEYFPAQWFDRLTLDEAYRIQLGKIERRIAAGERQIGWKVGLTAEPIQQQFGFHEPVFGCILDSKPSGHVFGRDELIRPGFESELCLRVGQTLSGEVDMATVRRAIDAVYPSLEIIETRGDFTAQIALAMADNAQQKTVVLGDPVPLGALARQSAELGDLAGAQAPAVRPRHPARRDHHERLVHAAVSHRARRSGAGGVYRRRGGAGRDAGVVGGQRWSPAL